MAQSRLDSRGRLAAAAVIFASGFVCGAMSQRPAEAQLGDMGGKVMEKAGDQGGMVGSVAKMGSAISEMEQHVSGLQKNLDTFKQVKAALGG